MLSSIVKSLAISTGVLFAVTSYKYLPGAYICRFYYAVFKYGVFSKPKGVEFSKELLEKRNKESPRGELDAFKITRYDTYCCPLECDYYFHKTNSSYFVELDLARTKHVLDVLPEIFWVQSDQNSRGKGKGSLLNWPFIPLGTVSVSFLKEIKPFESYYVETRVLTWDSKWIFLLSSFKLSKNNRTVAISIGKLIFRNGRETLPPQEVLELSGLYNDKVEEIRLRNLKYVDEYIDQSDYDKISFE